MAFRRSLRRGLRLPLAQLLRQSAEPEGALLCRPAACAAHQLSCVPAGRGHQQDSWEHQQGWRTFQTWQHALLAPPSPAAAPERREQGTSGGSLDLPPQASVQQQADQQMTTSTGQARHGADAAAAKPGAQLCDAVIDSLRQTQSKAERSKLQAPGSGAWSKSISNAAQTITSGAAGVARFVVAVPANITHHVALPWSGKVTVYKGWWGTIKKEAKHYWVGFKLLAADVKIASRLVHRVLHGKSLSRRERRQLTRTTADVFRLVPFIIFVVVPFMEFLLPVALKLFPNMLPSTFQDRLKEEEQMKKRVGAKLEMARFLQDTVAEMAKDMKGSKSGATQASAEQLYQFLKKVRAGESVNNFEITRFAQLFNDELTLDNLERIHLVNLCRFVGIPPFGTDAFLVSRLRAHLARIKGDDRAIKDEGLDALTDEELRHACRARGMRTPYGEQATDFMRRQLQEWLDLSLNRALPSSLLLLSRAFTITQADEPRKKGAEYERLKETIGALPNKVITEAGMEAKTDEADKAREYERKLEYLRREEELIREEEMEAEALLQSDRPTLHTDQTAPEMAAAAAAAAVVREAAASAVMDALEGESEEEKSSKMAAAKEDKMRKVISALAVLASGSGVSTERESFMGLVKNEIDRLNEDMGGRGSVSMVFHAGGVRVERPEQLQEIVPAKRLSDKVSGILQRIETELDAVDEKIGERMHILDLDNDGLISREELETAMGFLRQQLGEDELRMLLDKLNEFGLSETEEGPINVGRLMDLAQPDTTSRHALSQVEAQQRGTLQALSQKV